MLVGISRRFGGFLDNLSTAVDRSYLILYWKQWAHWISWQ